VGAGGDQSWRRKRAPAEIRAAGGRRELARYHVREDENGSSLYSMGQTPRYTRYGFTNRTLYKGKIGEPIHISNKHKYT
jgi:hypothetical protein